MRILVTGASGLLGLNLALEASREHEVIGSVKDHAIRTNRFKSIQSDLLVPGALEEILEQCRPDWVINCAALANLETCEAQPALAQQLNSDFPAKLAEHVARGGARLVHISTDAVFDGRQGDYREEDEPNPLSIYAKSKLQGEGLVMEINPEAIIARVNLFGWSLSGNRSLAEWFVNNLSTGQRVRGFFDVYFCPLLANDLSKILMRMLKKELHGLYHVVSRDCVSKYEFGLKIAELFGLDPELIIPVSIDDAGLGAIRSTKLTLIPDKLARDLGEQPPDLHSGLEQFRIQFTEGYPEMIRQMAAS
jgi:dTDP-4-dehydrorhamnose reductase